MSQYPSHRRGVVLDQVVDVYLDAIWVMESRVEDSSHS